MNRQAVRIANEVAAEGGALVAGNICNTWSYDPEDPVASGAVVRAQYEEQLGWAVEEGVDFVIAETNDYVGEALIGLEVCQAARAARHGHVRERAARDDLRRLRLRRGLPDPRRRTARRSSGSTAPAARRRCCRCSRQIRAAVDVPVAAQPVPYRTSAGHARVRVAASPRTAGTCSRSSSSRSSARASRWRTSRAGRATSASTTSASAAAAAPHHVRAMAEALGRETPASGTPGPRPHPVLGTPPTPAATRPWEAGAPPPDRERAAAAAIKLRP